MMKVQVIAIVICLLSVIACNNTAKSPQKIDTAEILEMAGKAPGMNAGKGTFTVKTPDGWSTRDTLMNRVEYMVMKAAPNEDSSFQANVVIVTQETKKGDDAAKFMAATQEQLANFFPDYKKIAEGERTVAGVTAKWVKSRYSLPDEDDMVNAESVILVKNNIAYAITLTTTEDELDKYTPDLEVILNSFNIK
ncbi:LpqN/LpqT family lipoprotein [Chitinophaga sp. 212800010-3]|uniref:LpqN/LpqT family lipoprotein n=1 Tax=unclassified Chitinophaga TaxID=2619133 RepID=UPI002E12E1C0